ncbi:MAG: GNAT family N-acetyltransferase [Anaerolineae bacterium]|nr:GNAT family N-acetyltransferase [Anaerolineae bacterium]
MSVIKVDPQTDLLWRELTNSYKSDVFHSPEWIRALSKTYDLDIQALILCGDKGVPVAGLPYCTIDDAVAPRIISLPFSDFCDPLVKNLDEWSCLIDRLLFDQCQIKLRCVHNDVPLSDTRFSPFGRGKWHSIDLEQNLDTIWDNVHSSAKRAIRKAQQSGITVRIAENKNELRSFFELHLGIRKYKYRLLAQPYCFFENLWDNFIEHQNGALTLATLEDRIISGVFFLEWKDGLYYKINASDPAYVSNRPNDLVIWEGIKYGKSKGLKFFDFGISDWEQEGLVRYKRKYATKEKTISFLQYKPPNWKGSYQEQPLRQQLPHLTDLFTNASVPDNITERAGEILYRFFT